MFKISEEDKAFLRQHIKNADELFKCDTAGPIIYALDEEIMYKGFDKEWFYNDFGKKAQDVRDRLIYDNKKR